jgi:23S rRNA (pseudouridine1915-N3)-methyltransferase
VRLALFCVGRLKDGPERVLVDRYAGRIEQIGRGIGLGRLEIVELDESRARRADDRKRAEAAALAGAIGPEWRRVALDERGRALTTEQFCTHVRTAQENAARGLALLIGGADGLDQDLTGSAELKLCFGAMTLPHQLVRVLAAEQLYRVATMLAGHPYNRT